uniref:Uncharacterized protein n=1 Tax=Ditylenchus dipsaci TaxID=166011 RepID=A0A915DMK9_9BILA
MLVEEQHSASSTTGQLSTFTVVSGYYCASGNIWEGRSQGRTNYNASSNYYQQNPPNPRSRNGSITYASEEVTRTFKGKPPNRRALGTELSSASENDSQYEPAGPTPYSTTKNDSSFFGGNEPVDKTYWNERSSQHQQPIQPQQQQRGSTGKPEPAPMIRMLKRNDEKSAEYFAHHATVLTTSQEMVNEQKQQEEQEEDDEFNATIPLTQLSQHTRSNNYNRREVPGETGKQARPQTASHPQNKGNFQATEDLSGQNYSSSHKKHSQNGVGGKFNRAPGPDVDQQEKRPSKSPSPGTPNSDANKPAATVALAQPPVDNVWEKRKEEREKPSATYPQSKPSRQFDYHFPSMSDAAKQEALDAAAASAAADTPELFRSQQQQQSRHQDVRFEQQQSTRGEVGGQWGRHASSNQWNPRTATQTESHWNDDDFSSGNKDGNRKQQRSNNYKNKSNEPKGDGGARLDNHNIFDASSDNTYEGNRREFVNSSKTTRNTLNGSSATQRKPLRGSTNKQGGGNRSQPTRATEDASYTSNRQVGNKQAKQQQRGQLQPATTSTTGAVVTDQSGSQLLRPNAKESGLKSQPEERDNFSNMDVFHAEDYHIESPKDGSHPTANADFTSESAGGGVKRGSLPARRVNKRTAAQANPHYANETSERSQPRSGNRGGRSNNNTEHQPSSDVPNDGQELCADKGQTSVNKAGPQKRDNARFSTTATQQQHPRGGVSRLGQRNPNKATRYKADINNSANNASSSSRQPSDRAGQLKSPVISDGGGAEEWETASESIDKASHSFGFDRKENTKKPMGNASRNTNTGRRAQPKLGNGDSNTAIADQQNFSSTTNTAKAQQIRSAGQKNVKPASHTYQGSSAKSNNNNRARSAVYTHEQHQSNNTKNAREDRKDVPKNGASNHYSARDGLAGVDINNASVIIIDNHPDRFLNNSVGGSRDELEVDDFEEVLSKKSKRQRLLQLEEERKKEQREKEKQEKIQEKILAKRAKQQQQHRRKTEKGTSVLQPEVSPNVLINTENKKDCTSGKNEGETVSELGSSALMLSTALFNTNSSCTVSKSSNVSPNTAKTTGGLVNGLAGSSLHDVTSETVWNNSHTLNTLDDFSSTPSGPVIPSPIARPIRVLNDSIRKSSTYSSSRV